MSHSRKSTFFNALFAKLPRRTMPVILSKHPVNDANGIAFIYGKKGANSGSSALQWRNN